MKRILLALLIVTGLSNAEAVAESTTPQAIFEKAVAAARTIADLDARIQILSQIAESQDEFGDRSGATATWHEALTTASAMDDSQARSNYLRSISGDLAKIGDIAGALAAAKLIQDPYHRALSLAEVAAVQATAGRRSEARATLQEALIDATRPDPGYWRDDPLSEIAATQARHLGDFDGALATVKAMEDAGNVSRALAGIAAAQANAGADSAARATLREALDSADAIGDARKRTEVLAPVVVTLADAGMGDDAVVVANEILNSGYQGYQLYVVPPALANAGKIDAAIAVAKAIEDAHYRGAALASISGALAAQNRVDEALTMAKEIQDSLYRVEALASVGKVQLGMGIGSQRR
jgi:hypothetical protein